MISEALYYPYTTVQSIESLKAMILYFDVIHIISPLETTVGKAKNIFNTLSILEDEGIVKYISPSELLLDYDNIMAQSMITDFNDPEFQSLSREIDHPSTWKIYVSKIPSALADSTFRKYILNIPGLFNGQYIRTYQEGPYSRDRLHEMIKRLDVERLLEYKEFRTVELPFEVGESLMINHALCACDKFTLTPLTDDSLHHEFLMSKFGRMKHTRLLKRILKDYGYIKDMTVDLASIDIIKETVPALKEAEITDVLEFRDYNKDTLDRFKVEMGKIITEVSTNMWDSDFHKKIIDIIDGRVKPAIQDIKDSTDSAKEKITRILKKGVTIAPLPLAVSAIPGCNPLIPLLASAGIVALDEYLESIKSARVRRRNWCAYLLEAQKKFVI